jgi:hypothetical protein
LETLILDGCNYLTREFLQGTPAVDLAFCSQTPSPSPTPIPDLLGPLEGQLCPCLTLLSLRQCPRISNGTFEEVPLFFIASVFVFVVMERGVLKNVCDTCVCGVCVRRWCCHSVRA